MIINYLFILYFTCQVNLSGVKVEKIQIKEGMQEIAFFYCVSGQILGGGGGGLVHIYF